jgi:hypothetical protein
MIKGDVHNHRKKEKEMDVNTDSDQLFQGALQ